MTAYAEAHNTPPDRPTHARPVILRYLGKRCYVLHIHVTGADDGDGRVTDTQSIPPNMTVEMTTATARGRVPLSS